VLVVLDNASGPEQVRPLLPGSLSCFTVVTSRDSLTGLIARDGAHRIVLDTLAPAESEQLVEQLLESHGRQTGPRTAASLAAACGHVPLALRLVAANLGAGGAESGEPWSVPSASGRLALMQVEGDPLASVRSAFALSYNTLPLATRRLFRRLCLLPSADFTVELAAAALDGAAADLAQLERLNLIRAVGVGRYAMHDLIRLYATALSEESNGNDQPVTIERVCRWYLDRIGAAATLLYPQTLRLPAETLGDNPPPAFDDGPAALSWLDAELHNLVATVTHAAQHGPTRAAVRIADGMRGYFWIRRHVTEWLAVAQAAISAADRDSDLPGLAANLISLASAYRCVSRYDESVAEYERSLDVSRAIAWREAEATALSMLAVAHAETGRMAVARDRLVEALLVNRRLGRPGSEAVVLGNLGILRVRTGELCQAVKDLTGALALYCEVGSPGGEAITLSNLGHTYMYLGRYRDAEQNLAAALQRQRKIGDRYGEAVTLGTQAQLCIEQGRLHEAIELATEALNLTRETGDRQNEAYVTITLGHVRRALGASDQAFSYYRRGHDLAASVQEWLPAVEAMIGEAWARLDIGDLDMGAHMAERAHQQATDLSFNLVGAQALTVLAAIHLAAARYPQALDCAKNALNQHREMGHLPGEARTHRIMADICHATGDPTGATACLDLSRAQCAEIGLAMDYEPR
jgi:tetratricopeptide (TPR) repeat protein